MSVKRRSKGEEKAVESSVDENSVDVITLSIENHFTMANLNEDAVWLICKYFNTPLELARVSQGNFNTYYIYLLNFFSC